jgi:hypothetical protein
MPAELQMVFRWGLTEDDLDVIEKFSRYWETGNSFLYIYFMTYCYPKLAVLLWWPPNARWMEHEYILDLFTCHHKVHSYIKRTAISE